MNKDQAIGALILVASVVGILIYGYLLYLFPTVVLQLTAFLGVAFVLGILAWIGYVMATTPPPPPLELEPTTTPTTTTTTTETPSAGETGKKGESK